LEAHEEVRRAVVLRLADPDPHLVAWVVPTPGAHPSVASLRDLVRACLPPTAVPDRILLGDTLPLLPNGKLDRAAVRELAAKAPSPADPALADDGGDPNLAAVTDIWKELLGVERVGADDDFFELGGHSLLAVELVAELNERLGADVSLADFFELPNPRSVAQSIAGTA
jgi:acyl carrier protein